MLGNLASDQQHPCQEYLITTITGQQVSAANRFHGFKPSDPKDDSLRRVDQKRPAVAKIRHTLSQLRDVLGPSFAADDALSQFQSRRQSLSTRSR
jgi:hypothetical protein